MGNVPSGTVLSPESIQVGPYHILHLNSADPFDAYAVVVTDTKGGKMVDALYNTDELAQSHLSQLSRLPQYAPMTLQVIKIERLSSLEQITTVLGKKPNPILQVDKQSPHVFVTLSPFIF